MNRVVYAIRELSEELANEGLSLDRIEIGGSSPKHTVLLNIGRQVTVLLPDGELLRAIRDTCVTICDAPTSGGTYEVVLDGKVIERGRY